MSFPMPVAPATPAGMVSLKFDEAKRRFFDRPYTTLMSKAKRFEYKLLWQFGAYCRKVAQNSIKQAKKASKRGLKNGTQRDFSSLPGRPPVHHNGPVRHKDLIWFGYNEATHSTVVGGVLRNGRRGRRVPELLEYGGVALVHGFAMERGRIVSTSYMATYLARPHMRPAFEVTRKKMLPRWLAAGLL